MNNRLKPGDIKIACCDEAKDVCNTFDWCFSIGDPGSPNLNHGKRGSSFYTFHDIEFQHPLYTAPDIALIQAMQYHFKRFFEDKEARNVLIHCAAGISRSTATGIWLLINDNWHYRDAVDHVFDIRKIALPNRLMIKLIDEYRGFNGALLQYVIKKGKEVDLYYNKYNEVSF